MFEYIIRLYFPLSFYPFLLLSYTSNENKENLICNVRFATHFSFPLYLYTHRPTGTVSTGGGLRETIGGYGTICSSPATHLSRKHTFFLFCYSALACLELWFYIHKPKPKESYLAALVSMLSCTLTLLAIVTHLAVFSSVSHYKRCVFKMQLLFLSLVLMPLIWK